MAPKFSKIAVHLFYGGEWNSRARGYEYVGGEEEAIWVDKDENYSGFVREIFRTTQWDSTKYVLTIKGRYNAARGGRLELKFLPILDDGSYESYLAMILEKIVDSAAVEIFVSRTQILVNSAPVNQLRTVNISSPPPLKAARVGEGSSILRSLASSREGNRLDAMARARGPSAPAPDWSSLPDGILMFMAELIPSFKVLAMFACVCQSWREAALAATISRRPPLLLRRITGEQFWRVHDPAFPSVPSTLSFYLPPISSPRKFFGVSRGWFIIGEPGVSPKEFDRITIVNSLSGKSFLSPQFPNQLRQYSFIPALFLDACTLIILLYSSLPCVTTILQWHIDRSSEHWVSEHNVCSADPLLRVGRFNDGRLFAASCRELFILELEPQPTLTELAPLPQAEDCPYNECWLDNCTHVIPCGESLIYLRLVLSKKHFRVKAFRLEESASGTPEWVQMKSLGDWTIFVSPRAYIPAVACRSPERWGVGSGCIYFAKCSLYGYCSGDEGDWHVVDTVDGPAGIEFRGGVIGLPRRCTFLPQLLVAPHI